MIQEIESSTDAEEALYCRDFVIIGNGESPFILTDQEFEKKVEFTGARFIDPVVLKGIRFLNRMGVSLDATVFHSSLKVEDVHFPGADFTRSVFSGKVIFRNVVFKNSYAIFDQCTFQSSATFDAVKVDSMAIFSEATFNGSKQDFPYVSFSDIDFFDFVDFGESIFECHVQFEDVRFWNNAEFVDTQFNPIDSKIRYRTPAVDFYNIEVHKDAVLTFRSTDSNNKLFKQDAGFRFKTDPEGLIQFENVHFSNILQVARERLVRLSQKGKVIIGAGCIKYRHQTDLKTISISEDNQPLVLELTQTFSHYFTVTNGINLGFEVVERSADKISFFYFTDENISEDEFLDRLHFAERDLWNLLATRLDGRYLTTQVESDEALMKTNEDAILRTVDGLSALLGTFFRVGIRIALGRWGQQDTQALIGSVNFGNQTQQLPVGNLHQVLMDHYTGGSLFRINSSQNQRLLSSLPAIATLAESSIAAEDPSEERTKILFLGAHPPGTKAVSLIDEVANIQSNLKRSKEREHLEFLQDLGVTTGNVLQLILDEKPNIVHFSGHGNQQGIVFLDDNRKPKLVNTKAISNLFKIAKEHVHCVVLNSCYSEQQARAIRQHIRYVIGMVATISNAASIAFSTGFYQGIGAGKEVPTAFNLGVLLMQLEGIAEDESPILL